MSIARVIGVYSDAMGSGKTTVADVLIRKFGYQRLGFAAPLKRMTAGFLAEYDIDQDRIHDYVWGSRKDEVIPEVGVTSRRLQQTLGTEWGRNSVDPNLWVTLWLRQAHVRLQNLYRLVCDDLRFLNEWEAIAALAAQYPVEFWKVERPGVDVTAKHASEGELARQEPHVRIINNGSLILLERAVECAWYMGPGVYHATKER